MSVIPDAEVEITPELLRALVEDQLPNFSDASIVRQGAGWDNEIYRLGLHHLIRIPRRKLGADHVEHESNFLPRLAQKLPLPIPYPIFVGQPGHGYPWNWTVIERFRGETVDVEPLIPGQAVKLAGFLKTLHQQDPTGAPENPFRGGYLHDRTPWFEERWERLVLAREEVATDQITQFWRDAVGAIPAQKECLIHGDLHPYNLLAKEGKISAVLDWGDLTSGDVTTDLACAWLLFEHPSEIEAFFQAYKLTDEATFLRARGWAIHLATIFLDTGITTDPRSKEVGRSALERIAQS